MEFYVYCETTVGKMAVKKCFFIDGNSNAIRSLSYRMYYTMFTNKIMNLVSALCNIPFTLHISVSSSPKDKLTTA